jgi:hypothetical protein
MTHQDAETLLKITQDLLGHLSEELQLNCTYGAVTEEAPAAAAAVLRAARVLRLAGVDVPIAAQQIMLDGPAVSGQFQ